MLSGTNVRPSEWPGQWLSMTPIQLTDVDTFPLNPEQWNDTDGDWKGDEPFSQNSAWDGCPLHGAILFGIALVVRH